MGGKWAGRVGSRVKMGYGSDNSTYIIVYKEGEKQWIMSMRLGLG